MTNEAVKVQATGQSGNIRTYTVANSPAIPKGTLMYLSGDNTASFGVVELPKAHSYAWAGIAVAEKETADGQTVLALDIGGVWDLVASNAITKGAKVILAGSNKVMSADDGTAAVIASGGLVIGVALETATAGETIRVDLQRN